MKGILAFNHAMHVPIFVQTIRRTFLVNGSAERSNSPDAGEHHSSNNLLSRLEKPAVPRSGAMSCICAASWSLLPIKEDVSSEEIEKRLAAPSKGVNGGLREHLCG